LKIRGVRGDELKDKKKGKQRLRNACEAINEKFSQIPHIEEILKEKFKKIKNNKPALTLIIAILFFVGLALFDAVVHVGVHELYYKYTEPGEFVFEEDVIEPTNILHNLTTENGYLYIWEPCTSCRAPEKGWLIMENPFYKISINLDHGYYLIFDKLRNMDISVYNDTVKSKIDMLTGCDLGFGDHNGDNPLHYATTAIHDIDGIEYEVLYEDKSRGFVLINTRGWDTRQKDENKGYDVEAEIIFGIFADRPYFINAVELTNLQRMGYVYQNPYKDPDEITQSWVLIDEYRYTSMKGGDNSNRDMWGPPLYYNVTPISRAERKPWHVGSAAFSKMFPRHILLGNKVDGGIIFSLPEGIFRFDDSLGIYGDQVAGEFIINVEEPQKAIAFTVNPVNELLFFYDFVEFNTIHGYKDLMRTTCERYGLDYPNGTLDAHYWSTKRYAYVITLVGPWYDVNADKVSDEIWALVDQGLEDFYFYQERICMEMEKTSPLAWQ
jgi:hypothetical protein